jgi:hypothetical protein
MTTGDLLVAGKRTQEGVKVQQTIKAAEADKVTV